MRAEERAWRRERRHLRVRRDVRGTAGRPRLSVFRSGRHIYAQVIDDTSGRTLAAASSLDPELRKELSHGGNVAAARRVGELVGKRTLEKGISRVAFDRGGYRYHGRVAALAEGARSAGLQF
ncbi:MAG: 50S ribosomal protein L18 [Bacillota bacterium]|nr:50S ribosomal protein L18 [Bacillota bacterium]